MTDNRTADSLPGSPLTYLRSGDSEMVERAVKALNHLFMNRCDGHKIESDGSVRGESIGPNEIVRTVILAMREPTPLMGYAGLNATDALDQERAGVVSDVWRAMIDAALSQKSGV